MSNLGSNQKKGGILPFDKQEASNLSSHKGYVNGEDMDLETFIKEAKSGKDSKNFYIGKVSGELVDRIKATTGLDVSGYKVAIRSDEVRHIFKKHGDALTESKRGQIAVDDSLMRNIVMAFDNPDEIVLLPEKDAGRRKAFELRKHINGYAIVVNGSADGRRTVQIDSYRIINKKKPSVALDAQSPEQTPKTGYGPASSDTKVPQATQKINSQNATLPEEAIKAQDQAYINFMDETKEYGDPVPTSPDNPHMQTVTDSGIRRSKDMSRNADAAYANNPEGRADFHERLEKPFYEAKGNYAAAVKSKSDALYNKVVAGRLPHACGGEPGLSTNDYDDADVCPTHVGVNRQLWEN